MDSNNFSSNTGVGEREGRVFSSLVSKRHFYLSHGIGRSGDIVEVQPKAAGSSVIYKLTNKLVTHALQVAGLSKELSAIVFPLATGMTLSICLSTMKSLSNSFSIPPSSDSSAIGSFSAVKQKKYVIWSRIDQKSCFKSILSSNLIPIIVDPLIINGEMITNIDEIRRICSEEKKDEILAILSTTSCFAPRQPDAADKIAEICKEFNICHVINNAYGLQCTVISKLINKALLKGRVDAGNRMFLFLSLLLPSVSVIQSTDKNFMVPVGGAILASPSPELLKAVSSFYPGRANSSPIIDLFITLLSMGENGYRRLLEERKRVLPIFQTKLSEICEKYGFKLIPSPKNTISFAIDVTSLPHINKSYTFFGSMLFQRCVSGCRVVDATASKVTKVNGYEFLNWGSHCNLYNVSYFTAACAMGMKEEEIELFIERLEKVVTKFTRLNKSDAEGSLQPSETNELLKHDEVEKKEN
jgi:O-phospho-L-seryl-tRNASec:L-selenocysteinyl-tRNA synthase